MGQIVSVITKSHGTFKCKIDDELQKCNPLSVRGIFLVSVDNGVVWGYDIQRYEMDEDNTISRKKPDFEEDESTEK